ncbi:MAG: hypothetical protein GX443_10600 [Deltaproteobacteria bacterium]|nr:hypothetical protein [Deltaproteobacteria bacterium]
MADRQIVQGGKLVASGERVEVFQYGVSVDPGFLRLAEEAYAEIESLLGRRLDTATLGSKVRIYISDSVAVSHVWMGYEHPRDPKGIVFLNPRVYAGAMHGTDATYIHEMTHLFTWRYRSHTLREGLADYAALQLRPGARVGPNTGVLTQSSTVPGEILECLGTTRPPLDWVVSDPVRRRLYYLASHRFVKFLVEKEGMGVFLKLYEAKNPEESFVRLYGASREELIRMAGMRSP